MVLTTLQLNAIRDDIQSFLNTQITHAAVGDGTSTPAAGDTALDNEQFEDTIDETDIGTSGQITKTLIIGAAENNGNSVSETAQKDGAAGNLQSRDLITAINKTSDIILYLDFEESWTVIEV